MVLMKTQYLTMRSWEVVPIWRDGERIHRTHIDDVLQPGDAVRRPLIGKWQKVPNGIVVASYCRDNGPEIDVLWVFE